MDKKINFGFLHFKQTENAIALSRTGKYISADHPVFYAEQPRNMGLFHLRTNENCYEGSALKFRELRNTGDELTLVFDTADGALTVTACFRLDAANRIISRKDTLRNNTDKALHILRFFSRMSFQSNDYEIYSQQSRWGLENQGAWQPLQTGRLELKSRRGRWTEGGTPFAAMRDAETANALAFHLIPNGDYTMRFSLPGYSTLKCPLILETGLDDERLDHLLEAGEEMEGTEVLIQELPTRDVHSGTAELHRYAYKNRIRHERPLPVVYNTWLDTMTRLEVPRLRRQLEAAKKAGCEVFVIDAGWYIRHGHWDEKTDGAFFGNMKEFADEVRNAGLKFGIWMEPEFFDPAAPVCQEHPEWFDPGEPVNGLLRMNFRYPEAKEYYYNMFAERIRRYDLDYIKIDMNSSLGVDLSGKELSYYIQSIHEIMTRLRNDFPGTVFENCSSGAMRTTLAELPYYDHHFISDNGNVLDVLHITQGLLLRFPPGKVLRWLVIASGGKNELTGNPEETVLQVQNATWNHYEETDLECGLLASMTGVLGFSGDLASFREETLQKIRCYTDYYTANRASFQRSVCTLLTSPQSIDHRHGVIGFQFTDPETDKHFIFTFYRSCDGSTGTVFPLKGLAEDKQYRAKRITFIQTDAVEETQEYTGAELRNDGLAVTFRVEQHGDFKGVLWEITPA